jgi:hypothetical protein
LGHQQRSSSFNTCLDVGDERRGASRNPSLESDIGAAEAGRLEITTLAGLAGTDDKPDRRVSSGWSEQACAANTQDAVVDAQRKAPAEGQEPSQKMVKPILPRSAP